MRLRDRITLDNAETFNKVIKQLRTVDLVNMYKTVVFTQYKLVEYPTDFEEVQKHWAMIELMRTVCEAELDARKAKYRKLPF